MDGKLVALWPVSTDTSRLRQDVNVVLCQDASENESTNYLCKTKPVAESSLQELKSSSASSPYYSGNTGFEVTLLQCHLALVFPED
ncbi:hypothetical protein Pcinc_030290 [Petrolisthes cinctipes]|uniref:Uncharacterized protein n=1 Tax=Petrolisthes cinctipes TaxID=88211 RepID=A0AAE1EZ47_PETCI|nr:hypothetical protein Pcinc_030290 [Petrolisthes cinctipes]